ncbi:MAG: hypothetical protein ACFFE5_10295 [Candidatus Thorarchaeota archaeon]
MMILLDFPITGELRFILMIFEWVFSIISLEFGILFMFRHKKEQHKFKYSRDIGYILLFFALSLSQILSVLGSYFTYDNLVTDIYHLISHIFLFTGFLLFIFVKEKQKKVLFKQFFFTLSLVILVILFIFFSFIDNSLVIIDSIIFLSLIYLFFIIFFIEFNKKTKFEGNLLKKLMLTFLAFLFLLIGLFLTSDYSIDLVKIPIRLIGSIIQLVGIIFFAFFFFKFPTFSEFEWKDKIEDVFLINKNGACIFYKSYIQKIDLLSQHLITSAITSVNIMLKEILKPGSREVSVIKKKGKLIYIFPSDLITGVIFSKKESKVVDLYMNRLILKVEQVYKNVLNNWDGDLNIFNPIRDIYEEIFST